MYGGVFQPSAASCPAPLKWSGPPLGETSHPPPPTQEKVRFDQFSPKSRSTSVRVRPSKALGIRSVREKKGAS